VRSGRWVGVAGSGKGTGEGRPVRAAGDGSAASTLQPQAPLSLNVSARSPIHPHRLQPLSEVYLHSIIKPDDGRPQHCSHQHDQDAWRAVQLQYPKHPAGGAPLDRAPLLLPYLPRSTGPRSYPRSSPGSHGVAGVSPYCCPQQRGRHPPSYPGQLQSPPPPLSSHHQRHHHRSGRHHHSRSRSRSRSPIARRRSRSRRERSRTPSRTFGSRDQCRGSAARELGASSREGKRAVAPPAPAAPAEVAAAGVSRPAAAQISGSPQAPPPLPPPPLPPHLMRAPLPPQDQLYAQQQRAEELYRQNLQQLQAAMQDRRVQLLMQEEQQQQEQGRQDERKDEREDRRSGSRGARSPAAGADGQQRADSPITREPSCELSPIVALPLHPPPPPPAPTAADNTAGDEPPCSPRQRRSPPLLPPRSGGEWGARPGVTAGGVARATTGGGHSAAPVSGAGGPFAAAAAAGRAPVVGGAAGAGAGARPGSAAGFESFLLLRDRGSGAAASPPLNRSCCCGIAARVPRPARRWSTLRHSVPAGTPLRPCHPRCHQGSGWVDLGPPPPPPAAIPTTRGPPLVSRRVLSVRSRGRVGEGRRLKTMS